MKELYLLRHGEKDDTGELTDKGREEAKKLRDSLPSFGRVISSDLSRTKQTAFLLSGTQPEVDIRAGYLETTIEVSRGIGQLASLKGISFLEAAKVYNDGELLQGIIQKAKGLNDRIDEVLASMPDNETALIISHDMTMSPAMVLRSQPAAPINYLSGYIINDLGVVKPYSALG